jgi:hypothetical protein
MLDPGKGRHGMIGNIMYPAGAGRRETDWQVNIVNGQVISARLVMRVNGMLRMSDNLAALLHDETLDNMKTLLGDEPSEEAELEGVRAAEVDREVDRRADRARGW